MDLGACFPLADETYRPTFIQGASGILHEILPLPEWDCRDTVQEFTEAVGLGKRFPWSRLRSINKQAWERYSVQTITRTTRNACLSRSKLDIYFSSEFILWLISFLLLFSFYLFDDFLMILDTMFRLLVSVQYYHNQRRANPRRHFRTANKTARTVAFRGF